MKVKINKKIFKIILIAALCLLIIGILYVFAVNAYVKSSAKQYIITSEEAEDLTNADCILVLGCGVRADGTPSDLLADRIEKGIELYKKGAAPKILMSGDHGTADYDEVNTMKNYAIEKGVPSSDIYMDHAGFCTYDSMYRAKEIFKIKKLVVVTQEYHMYRALYISKALGLDAFGVVTDKRVYGGEQYRAAREILARNKDFLTSIFKPEPTLLGDAIPVNGNGDITNDK